MSATAAAPVTAAPALQRPESRPAAPSSVRRSSALWLTAIAAGVFETALMVSTASSFQEAAGGIAVRAPIFVVMTAVIVQLRLGHNWARIALAVLLGVFGTLSLVVEPVGWLLEGHSLTTAISAADPTDWVFAGSRAIHLAAVLSALALMFTPSANRYFRGHRRSAVPG